MNKTIAYGVRAPLRTVTLQADFNLAAVTAAATRLRSWAMMRGVEIAGPPLLRLSGATACNVHVPLADEAMPHPETGIALDRCPGGESATLQDVRFGEVRAFVHELLAALGAPQHAASLEYHSLDGDFVTGAVTVVSDKGFATTPASVALPDTMEVTPTPAPPGPARVVTIARQHGTGGEAIAVEAARQLGFRLVDYGIVHRAAMEAGVSPGTITEASQYRGKFARILDALSRVPPLHEPAWLPPVDLRTAPMYTSAEYRAFVEDAIRDVAEQGGAVILGHGAQLVLAERADAFRVLITGGKEKRAARAIAGGVAPDDARAVIEKADEEREAYFREFYHEGWLDPATYDIVINTDRMSPETACRTIVELAMRRETAGSA